MNQGCLDLGDEYDLDENLSSLLWSDSLDDRFPLDDDAVSPSPEKRGRVDEEETGSATMGPEASAPGAQKRGRVDGSQQDQEVPVEPTYANGTKVVLLKKGTALCTTSVIRWDETNYLLRSDVRHKMKAKAIKFREKDFGTGLKYGVICKGSKAHMWTVRVEHALKSPSFHQRLQKANLGDTLAKLQSHEFEAECSKIRNDEDFNACLQRWDDSIRQKVRNALDLKGTEAKQGQLVRLRSDSLLRMELADGFDQYEEWVRQAESSEVYKKTMSIAEQLVTREHVVPAAHKYFKDVAQRMGSQEKFNAWINCPNLKEIVKQDCFFGYLRSDYEAGKLLDELKERARALKKDMGCLRFSNTQKGLITVVCTRSPASTWDPESSLTPDAIIAPFMEEHVSRSDLLPPTEEIPDLCKFFFMHSSLKGYA